jgi:hypothetical protein
MLLQFGKFVEIKPAHISVCPTDHSHCFTYRRRKAEGRHLIKRTEVPAREVSDDFFWKEYPLRSKAKTRVEEGTLEEPAREPKKEINEVKAVVAHRSAKTIFPKSLQVARVNEDQLSTETHSISMDSLTRPLLWELSFSRLAGRT